jgi:hypothetical protein
MLSSLNPGSDFGSLLKDTNLTLVEFQAPLFTALSVSPILLFRTCLLKSSRFGRNHFISVRSLLVDGRHLDLISPIYVVHFESRRYQALLSA